MSFKDLIQISYLNFNSKFYDDRTSRQHCSGENFEAHRRCTLTQEVAVDVEDVALIVKAPINSSILLSPGSEHELGSWTVYEVQHLNQHEVARSNRKKLPPLHR